MLDQVKVLYLGGYLLMPGVRAGGAGAGVRRGSRQRGQDRPRRGDCRAREDYLPRLDKLLPHVDVFLPNNHEGELITGERDPLRAGGDVSPARAATTIITLGGEGAVLVQKDLRLRPGVFSVPYLDASGGGDAFDAGYIYGLLHGMGPEDCLRIASALGASCVRAIGTTPGVFTRAECETFLQEHVLRIERI